MKKSIYLTEIFKIENPQEYKIHFASRSDGKEPLDLFKNDKFDWNEWKTYRNDFNRKYIFTLIDFYHETDTWLFAGIAEVVNHDPSVNYGRAYEVELTDMFKNFIGRLKINWKRDAQPKARRLENCIKSFKVAEILKKSI